MTAPSPSAPSAALADARALFQERSWAALAARVRPLGEEAVAAEPELGFMYAEACRHLGDTATALRVVEAVEPPARRSGERWLVLAVANLWGNSLFESGRMEEAERRFEELLGHATAWGDVDFAARAANGLGIVANVRGRRDLALAHYQRAIAGYTRIGNRRGLSQTHYNLGLSFRDLHFDDDADQHYQRAIDLAQATQMEEVIALAETERAVLRVRRGDGKLAASMLSRAIERFERLGDPTGRAHALRVLAGAARAQGDDDRAASLLDEALEVARGHLDAVLQAEVQRDRGLLLRDRGDAAAAREALLDSAEAFEGVGAAAEAGAVRAILASLDGDSDGVEGPGP